MNPGAAGPAEVFRPRLRVAACLDNLGVGGTELNAIRSLEHMDRDRFETFLVTLSTEGPLRARVDALGIPVLSLSLGESLYAFRSLQATFRLARQFEEWGIDVVHCHDRYTNLVGCLAGRLAGVPLVVASKRWGETTPAHRLVGIVAYHLAHRVLVNSEGAAESLPRTEFVSRRRVDLVTNFVDDAVFETPPQHWISQSREALGIPVGAPVVGVVASLRPIKEHETLLEAVARLTCSHPSLRVVFVGVGPSMGYLRAEALRLGLAERAIFAGLRPQAPSMHSVFDVSVLTSRSEGFPNSVVEAMAVGRPVVGTDVTGIRDAIANGRTGFLVPRGDAEALATALRRLLDDQKLRETLGGAAREVARARYSAPIVMKQLAQLYDRARHAPNRHCSQ